LHDHRNATDAGHIEGLAHHLGSCRPGLGKPRVDIVNGNIRHPVGRNVGHLRLVGDIEHAADHLERTQVLHGDALTEEILAEANVGDADALVAVTDDDRTNLLACALAHEAGCPIGIALSKDPLFDRIAEPLGVDALINPRATTVSSILRHVRRGKVRAVYSVGGGEAEVIEAQVMATSPIAGKRLRDIGFPAGSIVGAVKTQSGMVRPSGDTLISVGDVLVVFAVRDAVRKVEGMFRVSMDFF